MDVLSVTNLPNVILLSKNIFFEKVQQILIQNEVEKNDSRRVIRSIKRFHEDLMMPQ